MREALEITYWDDRFAEAFREAGMPACPTEDREYAERALARMEAESARVERFYRQYKEGGLRISEFIRIAGCPTRRA